MTGEIAEISLDNGPGVSQEAVIFSPASGPSSVISPVSTQIPNMGHRFGQTRGIMTRSA